MAGLVSVFGRRTDVEGPDGYVFFAADSRHPAYHLVKNVVTRSMYVSEFRLEDYPVGPSDILHTGRAAFASPAPPLPGNHGRRPENPPGVHRPGY